MINKYSRINKHGHLHHAHDVPTGCICEYFESVELVVKTEVLKSDYNLTTVRGKALQSLS